MQPIVRAVIGPGSQLQLCFVLYLERPSWRVADTVFPLFQVLRCLPIFIRCGFHPRPLHQGGRKEGRDNARMVRTAYFPRWIISSGVRTGNLATSLHLQFPSSSRRKWLSCLFSSITISHHQQCSLQLVPKINAASSCLHSLPREPCPNCPSPPWTMRLVDFDLTPSQLQPFARLSTSGSSRLKPHSPPPQSLPTSPRMSSPWMNPRTSYPLCTRYRAVLSPSPISLMLIFRTPSPSGPMDLSGILPGGSLCLSPVHGAARSLPGPALPSFCSTPTLRLVQPLETRKQNTGESR